MSSASISRLRPNSYNPRLFTPLTQPPMPITAESGEACAFRSASCRAKRMLSASAFCSARRLRFHACTGASPYPRNLSESSWSEQITTRVVVLPRSSPTAYFVLLLATLFTSHRRNHAIDTQVERARFGSLRFDLAKVSDEVLKPLRIVLVPKHQVHNAVLRVLGDDQVIGIVHVYFRDLLGEGSNRPQHPKHPLHARASIVERLRFANPDNDRQIG